MIRKMEPENTNTSDTEEDSLECSKPITSHEAKSQHTQAEGSRAWWWESLRSYSLFSKFTKPDEGEFLPLPSFPAEADARTCAIGKYLAAEQQQDKRQLKIILFGDEHDKSFFLKQARLFEHPLSNYDLADVRVEVRRFVMSLCRECLLIVDAYAGCPELINAHPILRRVKDFVSRERNEDEEPDEKMVELYCDDELQLVLEQIGHNLENIERRVLNDRFPYILNCPCTENGNLRKHLQRIFSQDYIPTEHDWFHFDQRRLDPMVQESLMHRDSHTLQFLQITNRSTQRRKWIHILVDEAACVVFICNLALYDQTLLDDDTVNRLHEDLMLFDSLVSSRWFTQTPFFVIFSNVSAFENKILQSPLSKWFPEFEGGSDGDEALKFIKERFQDLAKPDQNIHIQGSDIYSEESVISIIETMESTSLAKVLKDLGTIPAERQ